ncbi:MAG: HAD family hydrolase [Frankiaceae bacterium]
MGDAIEAVLFDLGGVLLASPFEAIEHYERARGVPSGTIRRINSVDPQTNAWARLERGEIDMEAFAALFEAEARLHGVDVGAFDVLALLFGDVQPQMIAAVDRLRDAGLRVGVLSNTPSRLPRSGPVGEVLGRFDVVVESFVVGLRKLGVEAPATVFLDDLGVNLKPARELGMRTIKVVDPGDALRELAELTGVQVWR